MPSAGPIELVFQTWAPHAVVKAQPFHYPEPHQGQFNIEVLEKSWEVMCTGPETTLSYQVWGSLLFPEQADRVIPDLPEDTAHVGPFEKLRMIQVQQLDWSLNHSPGMELLNPRRTVWQMPSERIVERVKPLSDLGIPYRIIVAGPWGPNFRPEVLESLLEAPTADLCRGGGLNETWCGGTLALPIVQSMLLRCFRLFEKRGMTVKWGEFCTGGPMTKFPGQRGFGAGWWGLMWGGNYHYRRFFHEYGPGNLIPLHAGNGRDGISLNYGALVGQWICGQVSGWAMGPQSWFWKACKRENYVERYGLPEGTFGGDDEPYDMPPDLVMRCMIAAASMGARTFDFQPFMMAWIWDGDRIVPSPILTDGICPFTDLVKDGALTIPDADQIRSLTPVALEGIPDATLIEDGQGYLSGAWERSFLAPHRDDYLGRGLYGTVHPFQELITATGSCGLLPLLPPDPPEAVRKRFRRIYRTNGRNLFLGGRQATARELVEDAAGPPVGVAARAAGTFVSLAELETHRRYQLVVVDPAVELTRPPLREARVRMVNLPDADWHIRDRLTGEELSLSDGVLCIPMPRRFAIVEILRR